MEYQGRGESVQLADARMTRGSGAHLAVPHREQVDAGAAAGVRGLWRGRLWLIAGILLTPLVITGYVGLTVLLLLPLVGLRMLFPRSIDAFGPPSRRQCAASLVGGWLLAAAVTRA